MPDAFQSIAEAGAFWESHDSTDYEDMMEDVNFEVDIKRRVYLVPVAGGILEVLRKKAKSQGVSTETLVNVLLQEHAG
ncbi:MAG: BrnA antitoxin family protein [Deltaproteobacteria bacterium]|nr:BrnA antitoxin family protein [Deltaproteobacteria bacterium]